MSVILRSYDVALAVRNEERKSFIARFRDPFFLQMSDPEDAPAALNRSFKTSTELPAAAMQLACEGYEISVDLARVTLYVLAKDANNPWKDRITIGRARNNDVSIDHASISKVHAYVTQHGKDYTIIDAGSRNGSWLNGEKISETQHARLVLGMQVQLGAVPFEFIDASTVYDRFKDEVLKRS